MRTAFANQSHRVHLEEWLVFLLMLLQVKLESLEVIYTVFLCCLIPSNLVSCGYTLETIWSLKVVET
jgi:hypothetical protein